jgi:hypothetical protein
MSLVTPARLWLVPLWLFSILARFYFGSFLARSTRALVLGLSIQSIRSERMTDKCPSQIWQREKHCAPRRQRPYPTTSSIEDPPKADSLMGQNCGGRRLARIAALARHEHVCLF